MNIQGITAPQSVKYLATSVSTFGANLLLIWLLTSVLGVFYLASVAVGFIAEVTIAYGLNRVWTFDGAVANTLFAGYGRAWLVALSTLILILAFEWVLVSILGVHYFLARILVGPIAYLWSYLLDGVFTFRALRLL